MNETDFLLLSLARLKLSIVFDKQQKQRLVKPRNIAIPLGFTFRFSSCCFNNNIADLEPKKKKHSLAVKVVWKVRTLLCWC